MSLLIVVRHSVGLDIYQQNITGVLYYIEVFTSHFTDVIVPMFFVISGYLFFQNFDYKKLKSKWQTRTESILVPFIIWNIIGFIFMWILFHIPQVRNSINKPMPDYNVTTWFLDVFIFTKYNITWFIRDLIVYIVISPLFYCVLKSRLYGLLLLALTISTTYITSNDIITYSIPWLLGAYAGIHFKEHCQKRYSRNVIIISSCTLLASFTVECMYFPNSENIFLLRLAQIPLIWISTDTLAISTTPKWWMRLSFFIYCSHHMILESIEKVFLLLFGKNYLGALLDFILAPVITFVVIFVIAFVLRPIRPVWVTLCGGRT